MFKLTFASLLSLFFLFLCLALKFVADSYTCEICYQNLFVSPCSKEAENLPRFGLVSPLKAERRRVRVVPIIGGESGDKEFTDQVSIP